MLTLTTPVSIQQISFVLISENNIAQGDINISSHFKAFL